MNEENGSFDRILRETLEWRGISLSQSAFEKLFLFHALLEKWQKTLNLTAIQGATEIADRHFAESLFIARWMEKKESALLDLGSGNGFPAIPLKIAIPDLKVVMIESRKKKCHFLHAVIREIGLKNIDVDDKRFESFSELSKRGTFDYLTMRAVKITEQMLIDLPLILRSKGKAFLYAGEKELALIDSAAYKNNMRHEDMLLPERRSSYVSIIEIA